MKSRRSYAMWCCLALCLAVAAPPAVGEEDESGSATPEPAPAPGPAAEGETDGEVSRIASNFAVLMQSTWADVAIFAGMTILSAVLWGIGFLFLGLILGLICYFIVRRLRLIRAHWSWYRYVRWLWVVIFMLSGAAGCAYAGAWFGVGRNVKAYIEDKRMLEKILGHCYVAALLDEAEYQATGQESAEDLQQVLADSQTARKLADDVWEEVSDEIVNSGDPSFVERWTRQLALYKGMRDLQDQLYGIDPRVLLAIFIGGENIDAYIAENPGAGPVIVGLATYFQEFRDRACGAVDSVVHPHIWTGLLLGLLAPVALAGAFKTVVHFAPGPKPAETHAPPAPRDSPAPPTPPAPPKHRDPSA